jgi:hypothetical protein
MATNQYRFASMFYCYQTNECRSYESNIAFRRIKITFERNNIAFNQMKIALL